MVLNLWDFFFGFEFIGMDGYLSNVQLAKNGCDCIGGDALARVNVDLGGGSLGRVVLLGLALGAR